MAIELLIIPSLFLGIIIGVYEAILLHRDVTVPTHRFGHMVHALIFSVIAVFATMNVEFIFSILPAISKIPVIGNVHFFRVAIGAVTLIKIHGASAAIKSTVGGGAVGLKETWAHSFIIATLVVIAPYIWPFLSAVLPIWLQ